MITTSRESFRPPSYNADQFVETSRVEVRESYTSRKKQLLRLISGQLPSLVEMRDKGEDRVYRLKLGLRRPLLWPPKHCLTFLTRGGRELFKDGEAVECDIHVFDKRLLDGAVTIASQYTKLTGKKAAVVKEF